MNTLDILKAAREKLAQPGAWVRGAMATNDRGQSVGYDDREAACWCMLGALRVVVGERYDDLYPAQTALEMALPRPDLGIALTNDRAVNAAEVIGYFDAAIAKLESAK